MKEKIKKTFLELIAIDGIYPNEAEVIKYVEARLSAAGVDFKEDGFKNIIAKIPGVGGAVLLSTHLDIPEPLPKLHYTVSGDVITSDGTGILGADPKTGLAIIVELLCDFVKKDHSTHAPIEVVLTRGEETGLLGARALDYKMINAKIGIVLDEDGPVTQVVTQAPAFVKIDAKFVGKVVHPREPEKGINALQAACSALMSLPWGYIADGVTWNVGKFKSGTARNSVPGTCEFVSELRSYDTALVVREGARVEKACRDAAQKIGARLEILRELEFEGYKLEKNHALFGMLEKTFKKMGLAPNYFSTFGGSDANIFNAHGIMSVPMGSGYYNAHEYTEAADISEMVQIFEFLNYFLTPILF